MKQWLAVALIWLCVLGLMGCSAAGGETKTVVFQNRVISEADMSAETLEWLEWYQGLTEEEQQSISYIPADLNRLCGYGQAEE